MPMYAAILQCMYTYYKPCTPIEAATVVLAHELPEGRRHPRSHTCGFGV